MLTPEELDNRIGEKIRRLHDLEKRFASLWGNSEEGANARIARELVMEVDVREIPAATRLTVVRQLMLALLEHDLIDHDREDWDTHLRAVSARMGIPFVELLFASESYLHNPSASRNDMEDWVEWCSENAPDRIQRHAQGAAGKADGRRRKRVSR